MQRQEDAFAVNQKQGQDGVTNSAGFKRNAICKTCAAQIPSEGKKNPTVNARQEWYLFYFLF